VSAADALVQQLPRITLVVGKGGVGKTTTAAALAMHSAERVAPTRVLSTDPAKALPSVLGHQLSTTAAPVPGFERLEAQVLDAGELRAQFMARWGDTIRTILDRGTYLDDTDIGPLVDTAMPGSDEIFSALELARLIGDSGAPRLVVDTAPTGHTLRLLNLPRTFRALIRLLDAMQSKHRFMVRTLTRSYRADQADAFLTEMTTLVTALEGALRDPKACAAVMVTNAQPLVVAETVRYLEQLRELRVSVRAIVWNGVAGPSTPPVAEVNQYVVPRLESWPVGRDGLRQWLDAMTEARSSAGPAKRAAGARSQPAASASSQTASNAGVDFERIIRPLTIVAGKGGVGKTTVACVLGLRAAESKRTLLVSTDPAPSLADALRQPIPDADTAVTGAPRLFARQMDASAAFARLRSEYEARVDALFDGLVAGGVDLSQDRAVARDLLSLAPPGVDEVYALSLLSDALFKDHYERVIVDPAPTGHLLRLLEMPELALAWSHQLLRLMLKYKDVTGLGETAQEILEFARNLRAVDALLRDEQRCATVLVTLDEPVVQTETARLAGAVRERGVSVAAVIRNRATSRPALPVPEAQVQLEAPATDPPPVGVAALVQWSNSWAAT
jgi:arsenite/tail-anchored protein-transporting ATPase